jgi:hypothetical protein
MKRIMSSLVGMCLLLWSSMLVPAGESGPGKTVVIPDGTEISAVTTETLSSKTANEDDPVNFRVDADVIVDGSVVIAKGTLIKGVVSNSKKSGHFGHGGQLNVRLEST